MDRIITKFTFIFLVTFHCFSQNEGSSPKKTVQNNEFSKYISTSLGFGTSKFRDFATSPLTYKGVPIYLSLSYIKLSNKKELELGLSYSIGIYNSNYNSHHTSSLVNNFALFYGQLYTLNRFSSEKFNLKVGGLFNTTSNFRVNQSFLNNSLGIEIIPTLFGSIKITQDISRRNDKNGKILFIKYKLNQKTRNLSFRLNIGLINSAYRNGFLYLGQSSVLNNPNIFDSYEFKIFSGFRMSSALDYTMVLKNKNKVQFSYLWDAYKTSNTYDQFEMAQHVFKVSLLFKTNKS